MERLHDAQRAFLSGSASPEQLHLLEQERAGEEMKQKREEELRRRKENSLFGRAKAVLIPTQSRQGTAEKNASGSEVADDIGKSGFTEAAFEMQKEVEHIEPRVEEVFRNQEPRKGQLDILADNATNKVMQSRDQGLLSWLRGR